MSRKFTIFGMFRSGTTLLARMLHTHRDIACASDPFRPYFNYLRYDIADEIGVSVEPYDPIGDYFADAEQHGLFETIQEASLDREFPDDERERLLNRLLPHGRPFSDNLMDELDGVRGETFREVYDDFLSYVPEVYGDGTETWQGTKEVWCTEFSPLLADAYPESKFFLVIRDPRAVVASKNVHNDKKYPWLFLLRHWRKLSALAWLYSEHASFSDRVQIVRYEDIVQSPRETAVRMCDHLGIDLDERILNPSNFVDGAGNKWLQNTSYDDKQESFNTDSVDRWNEVLDDRTIEYVEQLTLPEMELFGYETQQASTLGLSDDLLLDPPTVPHDELADWIQPFYADRTPLSHVQDVADELVRHRMLSSNSHSDEAVVEPYFLDSRYFVDARDAL